uniref:UBC core domain-containing protein n=1 Tax=Timema poppense TaxID=170557 RepID=A0A7R9H7A7_TIMPO|nr:unnamed protein product [Timema poppensis]
MGTRKVNSVTARLKQDYLRLKKDPVPYVVAEPVPSNILEWVIHITEYYSSPMASLVLTDSSQLTIDSFKKFRTNTRLCLSISDFHPDTWNPAWSVSTILTGLLSFMIERSPTLGSIESSDYEKRQLAAQSLQFNLKDKTFCELFPDLVSSIKTELERRAEAERTARSSPQTVSSSDMQALLRNQFGHNDQSPMHNAITNLCVIIGFAAFAFTVKYVLQSIATE